MVHPVIFRDRDRFGDLSALESRRLLDVVRRHLPLVAHPRGRLRASLNGAALRGASESRCRVTNVFDAGESFGLMCQIEIGESGDPSLLVAPLTDLSFERTHPIARQVADYRRRRASGRNA